MTDIVRQTKELVKNGCTPSDPEVLSVTISVVQKEVMDAQFRLSFAYSQFTHATMELERLQKIQSAQ